MNNISKKTMGILVAIVVLVGGLSFYGGMKYASANGSTGRNAAFAAGGMGQFRSGQTGGARTSGMGRGMMGGGTVGQIISKDDKSITVKLADGGSKIVFLSQGTMISKNAPGTADDLTVGAQVVVGGAANQDGSVNAQFIQLGGEQRARPAPNTTQNTTQ